jgi:hypothetical protein
MVINFLQQRAKGINLVILFTSFFIFLGYYLLLLFRHTNSDIQAHAQIAYSYAVNNDKLFPNFLYFFLVAMLAGFSKNIYLYYGASVFLISLALCFKFFLSQYYLRKYSLPEKNKPGYLLPAIAMMFAFALPGVNFFQSNEYYLGQLPPNVWHNSTVIFLMPFTILLFFKSYNLLFSDTINKQERQWQIFLLIVVNALIKPSFLFTLIPSVFFFFVWFNLFSKTNKKKMRLLLPFAAGLAFIAIEYYLIFTRGHISNVVSSSLKSSVIIEPFLVWKNYSPNMLIALITSCFFPLVYVLISKGKVLKNTMVQFAGINYIAALGIWILFAEEGVRKFDANFCWQVIVASYLLFFSFLLHFFNENKLHSLNGSKQYVVGGAFLLHFIWGIVYWMKIIIFRGYF